MKQKNKIWLYPLMLMGFVIVFANGCKKGDPEPEPTPTDITISVNESTIKAYQIVILTVTGTTLTNSTYSGTIGSTAVTFMKVTDTEMIFLTPSIDEGTYSLACEISKTPISIEVQASATISDPAAFVSTYVADANNDYGAILTADSLTQLPPELASAKDSMNQALVSFNNLSPNEKMITAIFLQNNQKYIDDLKNSITGYYSGKKSSLEQLADLTNFQQGIIVITSTIAALTAAYFGAAPAAIVGVSLVAAESIYRLFTGKMSPPMALAKKVLVEIFKFCVTPMNYFFDFAYDIILKEFKNFTNKKLLDKKTTYSLNADEIITFKIKPSFRSLEAGDVNSTNTIISGFVTAYNKISSLWTDYIANKFGNLPSNTPNTEQQFADILSKFSINITTNSANVSSSPLSGNASSFTTKFTTTETTDQNFTFEVIYSDMGITAKKSIDAILSASLSTSFTDVRDGNVYQTITIGNQVWMASNLKYLPSVAEQNTVSPTTPYYYVYNYSGTSVSDAKATGLYNSTGVLYNWPAAKTACPAGWHLPSDAEWTQLTDYLGGASVAGGKLKITGFQSFAYPNTGATNSSGFTAKAGGFCGFYNTGFEGVMEYGFWWTGTEKDASLAWNRIMSYDSTNVMRYGNYKYKAYSVRCIKD